MELTDISIDAIVALAKQNKHKNSTADEIANVNFYAVRPKAT